MPAARHFLEDLFGDMDWYSFAWGVLALASFTLLTALIADLGEKAWRRIETRRLQRRLAKAVRRTAGSVTEVVPVTQLSQPALRPSPIPLSAGQQDKLPTLPNSMRRVDPPTQEMALPSQRVKSPLSSPSLSVLKSSSDESSLTNSTTPSTKASVPGRHRAREK